MGGIMAKNSTVYTPATGATWWLAADDVSGANGSNPAQLVDRVSGILFTPEAAVGGSLETTGWNNAQKSIRQNNQAWKCTDAAIQAVLSGGVNWWMGGVIMPLAYDSVIWSAGDVADAQKYMALQAPSSTEKQQYLQRFGAAAQTIDAASRYTYFSPFYYYWQCDAAGIHTFIRDGWTEQTFTRLPSGLTVNKLLLGALITGPTSTVTSSFRWRHFWGGTGNLTTNQQNLRKAWVVNNSQGFRAKYYMAGALNTGRTFVAIGGAPGQSNQQGQGPIPTTQPTAPITKYVLYGNSFLGVMVNPTDTNTNTPYSVLNNSGIGSSLPSMVDRLYSTGKLDVNDALFYCPTSIGGSAIASWQSNSSTSPPPPTAMLGMTKFRILELFYNLPPGSQFFHIPYQGETEAQTAPQAAAWSGHATTTLNALDAFLVAEGIPLIGSQYRLGTVLPVTGPDAGSGFDFWTDVRTAQISLYGSRAECITIQAPDGPWAGAAGVPKLHGNMAFQDALGIAYADALPIAPP